MYSTYKPAPKKRAHVIFKKEKQKRRRKKGKKKLALLNVHVWRIVATSITVILKLKQFFGLKRTDMRNENLLLSTELIKSKLW